MPSLKNNSLSFFKLVLSLLCFLLAIIIALSVCIYFFLTVSNQSFCFFEKVFLLCSDNTFAQTSYGDIIIVCKQNNYITGDFVAISTNRGNVLGQIKKILHDSVIVEIDASDNSILVVSSSQKRIVGKYYKRINRLGYIVLFFKHSKNEIVLFSFILLLFSVFNKNKRTSLMV